MTARKQSTARLSKLAGKYLNATDAEMCAVTLKRLFADIRTLAASVLSQDETK